MIQKWNLKGNLGSPTYFVDASKYKSATNWSPNTSLFDELKKTLDYIEANYNKTKL